MQDRVIARTKSNVPSLCLLMQFLQRKSQSAVWGFRVYRKPGPSGLRTRTFSTLEERILFRVYIVAGLERNEGMSHASSFGRRAGHNK